MRANPKWHSKPAAVEAEARFKLLKGWEKKKAVFISKRRKCIQRMPTASQRAQRTDMVRLRLTFD